MADDVPPCVRENTIAPAYRKRDGGGKGPPDTPRPVFDAFNIGLQKFQQSGAWRVWVDEVAFDAERIGWLRGLTSRRREPAASLPGFQRPSRRLTALVEVQRVGNSINRQGSPG